MTSPASIRPALWFALLTSLTLASAEARTEPAADTLAADLDQLFTEAYPADEPGAAVLIRRGDEIVLRKGYGMAHLELGVPVEPDMVFRLGSITKQFTGVGILMLEQDGKLSVDDPITRHLPDYPPHEPPITIEHLLTHTSGIPSYTGLPDWAATWRDDLAVDELIAMFRDLPLEFEPGSQWRYNNSGYFLLGAIIEAASGQTYEAFVESRVFEPLGMDHSDYGNHGRILPRRVQGYHRDAGAYVNAPFLSMTHPYAAGSLLSTVDDMDRWDQALYTDRLLPAAARERLWQPYHLSNGDSAGYGYGWSIQSLAGQPVISHGGGIHGFATMGIRLPEERIFVTVLSNNPQAGTRPGLLAQRAVNRLQGLPIHFEAIDVDAKTLERYAGVYRIDDETTRVVTLRDGQLFTQRDGGTTQMAKPFAIDAFFYGDDLTVARFVTGDDGGITHMTMEPWGGPVERAERTDAPIPEGPAVAQVDPDRFDRLAGDYELGPGFVLTVTRDGSRLLTQATGQQAIEIFPTSETEFFNSDIGARITFSVDGDGPATDLVLEQGGQRIEAARVGN